MIKQIKNYKSIIITIICILSLIFLFGYISFNNKNIVRQSDDKVSKLNYALVNEDDGIVYNDNHYNLGSDFVTLINQDSKYNWETTSRDMAEAGFNNGQYDAQIIIPRDFSEKVLSLQEIIPEKALISYKVRGGQNEITNKEVQEQVNSVINNFNTRIIRMYFSSIINNLSEAQYNVSRMVNEDEKNQNNLKSKFLDPMKVLPDSYNNIFDYTSLIVDDNKSLQEQQKDLVNSMCEGFNSNSESIKSINPEILSLQDSIKQQTQINLEEANEELANLQELLKEQKELTNEQWNSDKEHYNSQKDKLISETDNNLKSFETEGQYSDLLNNIKDFQSSQNENIKELENKITNLNNYLTKLQKEQQEFAEKYYGNKDSNPDNADKEEVLDALKSLLSNNKETKKLYEKYKEDIDSNLSTINLEGIDQAIQYLKDIDKIDNEQYDNYQSEINIISRYLNSINMTDHQPSKDDSSNLIDKSKTIKHDNSFTQTITLAIDPSGQNEIELCTNNPSAHLKITKMDTDNIKKQLNEQLNPYNYKINNVKLENNKLIISPATINNKVVENTNDNTPQRSGEIKSTMSREKNEILPKKISFTDKNTYTIDPGYTGTLNVSYYSNKLGDLNSSLLTIDDTKLEIVDISTLLKQLQLLDQTSQKITTIFSDPNQNITIPKYSEYLNHNVDNNIFELASEKSIYYMYTKELIDGYITEDLYKKYRDKIDSIYNEMSKKITTIQTILGKENSNPGDQSNDDKKDMSLNQIYNNLTRPEKIVDETEKLGDWYEKAISTLEEANNSWTDSESLDNSDISEKPSLNYNSDDLVQQTSELINELNDLSQESKEMIDNSKISNQEFTDMNSTIKDLNASTEKLKQEASKLGNDFGQEVQNKQNQNQYNQNYANKFNKVLSNAKDGGKDNPKVFNFLSNPLSTKGELGNISKNSVSVIPYYATVILIFVAIFTSYILSKNMKVRKINDQNQMVDIDRIWENTPNIILITGVGLLLSLIYSIILYINFSSNTFWYSLLISMSLILIFTGGFRVNKVITTISIILLSGIFLMLSPLLGITTKVGSTIYWIYRVSPFQNIQNGYAMLYDGGKVGIFSYIFLILLIILGYFWNLFIKNKGPKEYIND